MFKKNLHVKALLQRLAIAYLLYSLSRLIFFVINTSFHALSFSKILGAFYFGLLFDTSAIVYTHAIFIVLHILPWTFRDRESYQMVLKYYFIVVNSVAILLNLIDSNYYSFSGKRSGLELFEMKKEITGHVGFHYLIDYWYVLLILLFFIYLLAKLYNATKIEYAVQQSKWYYQLLWIPLFSLFSFVGARGGFALIPLNTFDAARLAGADAGLLASNTPFTIIISVQQVGLDQPRYFSDEVADQYYPLVKKNPIYKKEPKPNIVLVIVESLGKEYVGFYNNGEGYTPFIDSLATKSTVYTQCFANCKRSIEGIASIMASMPSWMETDYISSYYQTNQLKSIGAYLAEDGYNSSFYHGGVNGTMSFDNFIAHTKGGDYYGKNEYPNQADYDGNWGIYDDKYLDYWANELNAKPKPFFSACFTISSHHPYNIPAPLQQLFPIEKSPMYRAIKYADYSLKQFFNKVKYMPWYKNTVFIITADHSSVNSKAKYNTSAGKFEIPLLLFDARKPHFAIDSSTKQQLSILPIILKTTHYAKPFFSFDGDDKNPFSLSYQSGYYQIIKDSMVYHFTGTSGLGLYQIKTDSLMQRNLINNKGYRNVQMHLDSLIKAVIQNYNNALINNKMIATNKGTNK